MHIAIAFWECQKCYSTRKEEISKFCLTWKRQEQKNKTKQTKLISRKKCRVNKHQISDCFRKFHFYCIEFVEKHKHANDNGRKQRTHSILYLSLFTSYYCKSCIPIIFQFYWIFESIWQNIENDKESTGQRNNAREALSIALDGDGNGNKYKPNAHQSQHNERK